MPDFIPHTFDPLVCRAEVEELRALLRGATELRESVFRDFFKTRLHAPALIGSAYHPTAARINRVAREYPLFGDFRCDLALGDSVTYAYTFIELEDAGRRSLFIKHGAKATREWSPRFDRGYSQIVDWFHKLQVMTNTPDMEVRFGKRSIDSTGVLIVGRDHFMDAGERLRLEWRCEHVIVNSKRIICVTFDQLLRDLTVQLDKYELAGQAGG